MQATLLVELLTEELPPRALSRLGEVFADAVFASLVDRGLVAADARMDRYASPRRLALTVQGVVERAQDTVADEKLMPVSVALDAAGAPTPALLKKLQAKGIPVAALPQFTRRVDGKSETLFHAMTVPGAVLDDVLAGIVLDALKKLPIPKLMRWSDCDFQFVRPVHGLVMLHGGRIVPGMAFGHQSGRSTRGHRFMGDGEVTMADADEYARALYERGAVMASFEARRALIVQRLAQACAGLGDGVHHVDDAALIDEVTALVENPNVYVAQFEPEFLAVPQECLILTMKANQKYFPLLDAEGRLLNRFLVVSNMQVDDAHNIVSGNERVVRARLSDARFFFEQDRKTPLAARITKMDAVVYHNRLGSQFDRVMRVQRLSTEIATRLDADVMQAARAGLLAKADLLTDMVGEFPELQGTMGRYYALHDGEAAAVAAAVEQHYRPRFAGDALPEGPVASAVALADKLDALAGFFGIGQIPTGDKDPFALRRAALGVLRILMEAPLALDIAELIAVAAGGFRAGQVGEGDAAGFEAQLLDFMFERLRNLLRDAGHDARVIDAVLAQRPTRIDLVTAKLAAVAAFSALPEAQALAAANKRIVNILRKADGERGAVDAALFSEPAERELHAALGAITPALRADLDAGRYGAALNALAQLRAAVDRFFDGVMVNTDDVKVRMNRLALLGELAAAMNAVADISRLELKD
ncbi:MAG: glycine--tRNA ligase subunit beta [Gammaproteobacteria bacterium]|nr:glycine--tRNA ligase subunit beta [Gammaproteobacteria bacterium]MBU0770491.1 glycine--tRNA ligase subunit beta [Gammaproteobacteria bacterium]MBU0856333.1 glycine--tRNA ligase subunit beta [Gammaproteobacteria bacterium]MBU1845995.1 glycine--tRNA ligase subunit beta [Gammaproteobacteria bacterium]